MIREIFSKFPNYFISYKTFLTDTDVFLHFNFNVMKKFLKIIKATSPYYIRGFYLSGHSIINGYRNYCWVVLEAQSFIEYHRMSSYSTLKYRQKIGVWPYFVRYTSATNYDSLDARLDSGWLFRILRKTSLKWSLVIALATNQRVVCLVDRHEPSDYFWTNPITLMGVQWLGILHNFAAISPVSQVAYGCTSQSQRGACVSFTNSFNSSSRRILALELSFVVFQSSSIVFAFLEKINIFSLFWLSSILSCLRTWQPCRTTRNEREFSCVRSLCRPFQNLSEPLFWDE